MCLRARRALGQVGNQKSSGFYSLEMRNYQKEGRAFLTNNAQKTKNKKTQAGGQASSQALYVSAVCALWNAGGW